MITLSNVSKQFDGKRRVVALSGISLEVARGELVSIVGPSGSLIRGDESDFLGRYRRNSNLEAILRYSF